jgi:integrase/recombinase XerD
VAVEGFLQHLEELGRAPRTVERRRSALRHFIRFLADNGIEQVTEMTVELFDLYASSMRAAGWKPASIDSNLRAVRLLYRHLAEVGTIFEDPLAAVVLRRPPRPPVRVLGEQEVKRLLHSPDVSLPAGLRDRAILEVLYATGMRREELQRMRLPDVDLAARTVRVTGKGDRERVLPLGRHACRRLRAYIEQARPGMMQGAVHESDALWVSRFRRALSNSSIDAMVRGHARSVGLDGRATPHTLRRSCATHLLDNGAEPMAVATLLGHSSLKSLAHYLRVKPAALRAMHAATPPGQ